MLEQRRVPFPRRLCLAVELVQTPSVPQAALDPKARPVMVERDRVRGISLQLNRVGTGLLCSLDETQRTAEIAIVVAGKLGNHIRRMARTDRAPVNLELAHHHVVRVCRAILRPADSLPVQTAPATLCCRVA